MNVDCNSSMVDCAKRFLDAVAKIPNALVREIVVEEDCFRYLMYVLRSQGKEVWQLSDNERIICINGMSIRIRCAQP